MSDQIASKSLTWPYLIVALLSLVGLGDAIYLTIQDLTGQNLRCTIQLDCKLPILLAWSQAESVRRNGPEEVTLGEMRPLVGRLGLRPDQRDLPLESRVTKTRRHSIAGGSAADD